MGRRVSDNLRNDSGDSEQIKMEFAKGKFKDMAKYIR